MSGPWLKTASHERMSVATDSAQCSEQSGMSGDTTQCERVFVVDLANQETSAPRVLFGRRGAVVPLGSRLELYLEALADFVP